MLCEIKLSCECFNTSVTIEGSYLSVWQPVRVQIGNSVAVLVALVAFFRLLPQGARQAGCSAIGATAEIKCERKTILNQAEGG